MIDEPLLKWLYIGSLVVCSVAIAVSHIIWQRIEISLGVAVGYVISLLPFLSWHWVLRKTKGFQLTGNKRIILLVTFGKYIIIAGSLYFVLVNQLLDTVAIVSGMFITFLIVMALSVIRFMSNSNNSQE